VYRIPSLSNISHAPGILVDYHRTGGIAGFDDHLVIFENGGGAVQTRSRSSSFTLNSSQIAALATLFDKALFASLNEKYTAQFSGNDCFTCVIMYRGKTVTTQDTAIPPNLQPVITELNRIVAENTGR
jgi:hypothetical protein